MTHNYTKLQVSSDWFFQLVSTAIQITLTSNPWLTLCELLFRHWENLLLLCVSHSSNSSILESTHSYTHSLGNQLEQLAWSVYTKLTLILILQAMLSSLGQHVSCYRDNDTFSKIYKTLGCLIMFWFPSGILKILYL